VSTVARPDLLLVGALLHDIGKGWPGDHTEVGIRLVGDIGRRMGFDADDVAVLEQLVRHHLLLPDVATRRDIGDDDVIESVAGQVGSLLVLELLAALTEADSLATGPSAWGSWKAGLVEQLVDRVAHVLRGGEASEVTAGDDFPDPPTLELLAQGRTAVVPSPPRLTVVCPDRPGVLSRVAGALALHGVAVLAADAGGAHGMAASRFVVGGGDDVDWDAVAVDVRRAVEGRVALEARLAAKSRSARRPPAAMSLVDEPTVRVDNHVSASCTVVEVRAPDRVGVLYRITRALADLDLDIRTAKATTLGHEVVDAFYVQTGGGGKVVDRDHLRELERAILHQIGLL
jgi:[protein-PII] uridylyltransferase